MNAPATTSPHFAPISWRRAVVISLIAIACFHVAYTPANSGWLALGILGYVISLVQLARLRTTRQAFYFGLAAGFACIAPQLECFWRIFGAAAMALWLVLAFWIALFVAVSHLALASLGPKRAAFLIPFFWTGLEYFRSELYYLKFSWLNVGYVFAEFPIVPLKFVGVYGVGFLVVAVAALLQFVRRDHFRQTHLVVLMAMAALAFCRLWLPAFAKVVIYPNLGLAGVQLEFPNETEITQALDKTLLKYQQIAEANPGFRSHTNLDLIVLPEYTLNGAPPQALKNWCSTNQKFLIVGGKDESPGTNFYDSAFVISTNGEVVFKQAKSVPIQFFKDGLPAKEQKLWNSPWGKIGICICYDLSYTRVTDELVKQGAQMIIVPTMDVTDWGRHQHELHARIAPVRAAEYGIPIFRVASSGISQGVDQCGWVRATALFPGEGATLFFGAHLGPRGQVPADRLLALVCLFITVVFLLRTMIGAWRKPQANRNGAG